MRSTEIYKRFEYCIRSEWREKVSWNVATFSTSDAPVTFLDERDYSTSLSIVFIKLQNEISFTTTSKSDCYYAIYDWDPAAVGGVCTQDARRATSTNPRRCSQVRHFMYVFPNHATCWIAPCSFYTCWFIDVLTCIVQSVVLEKRESLAMSIGTNVHICNIADELTETRRINQ